MEPGMEPGDWEQELLGAFHLQSSGLLPGPRWILVTLFRTRVNPFLTKSSFQRAQLWNRI